MSEIHRAAGMTRKEDVESANVRAVCRLLNEVLFCQKFFQRAQKVLVVFAVV